MSKGIRYGYADTSEGQIHYREAGQGPPLLLLHESPLSGAVYEPSLGLLGTNLRAIATDTPGYGASEAPVGDELSIKEFADRMTLFLDSMGLDQVALVGHHTGASIAIQMAADLPERIKALIVMGCPLFYPEERKERQKRYLNKATPFSMSTDGTHMQTVWDHWKKLSGPNTLPEVLHMMVTESFRWMPKPNWGWNGVNHMETELILPTIKCPTLFLNSEGDELRRTNEASVALTPNGEGKIINTEQGQWHANNPEEFGNEVLNFLERVGYFTK